MTIQPLEIDNPVQLRLSQLTKELQNNCRSGLAFALLKKGDVIAKNYCGYADITHKVPVSEHTKFPLASISKIYTSLILHKLAADGAVDLNKPLNHYVPETEAAGEASIRSVLLMSAGLCDAFEMFLISGIGNLISHDIEDHYLGEHIFISEEISFKNKFIYSNSGYIFLAKLVENVTGKTYEQALKEHIFDPLELQHTDYFDGQWRVVEGLAIPNVYQERDDEHADKNYIGRFYRGMAGAGHLAANLNDMIKFSSVLMSMKLGDVDISAMLKKKPLDGDTPSFYGAGLQVIPLNQRRHMYGHSGSYYGIKTALFVEPVSQTAVVILSNDNDIESVKWAARLLAAASEEELLFPLLAEANDETPVQQQNWLCPETGLHITLTQGKNPQKIELYGDRKDLIFLGEGRYMVPYALCAIMLDVQSADKIRLNVGGITHDMVRAETLPPAPQNFMEYVGRYKNPNSDLEMNIKMVPKKGLFIQFGNSFNAVRDAQMTPLSKDYFMAEVQESNGTPTTIYLKFEREQFSQMISGLKLHEMRVPQLTYRRLKSV